MTMELTPAQRADLEYRRRNQNTGRHLKESSSLTIPITDRPDSVTTDDFSRDRDTIQRMKYVFDRILEIVPKEAEKDMRFTFMKTMMQESLKDLARIPDRVMLPMVDEIATALNFVVHGSMAELRAYQAAQAEEAVNGSE
jgi:hypothetical protein